MNDNFLVNRLTGQWIVQSTNYSFIKQSKAISTLVNQIKCTQVKDLSIYSKITINNPEKQDVSGNTDLYCMESNNNAGTNHRYYLLLTHEKSIIKLITKLDHNFAFLNKFVIHNQSSNQLTIVSCHKRVKIMEKIYFLKHNLKVVKSIIKKDNICIGSSFSSEIRIS